MIDKDSFFKEHLIVHTHVPKTAGSTLVTACKKIFGAEQVYDIRMNDVARPNLLAADAKSKIRVLTGHFRYGGWSRHFERKKIYIASVRDPVSRFNSKYRFVIERPNHKGYATMSNLSFDEVVRNYIEEGHKSISNSMARILVGTSKVSGIDAIIEHIENNYWIVVPQSQMDDFLTGFFQLFGETATHEKTIRANVGSGNSSVSPETAAIIAEHNPLDVALYDFVCQRYADWRLHMADRILR